MFKVGDRVVHPLHGVGVIEDVTTQKIKGEVRSYYVFRALNDALVVLIPESSYESIGVRPVMDESAAQKILEDLSEPMGLSEENWNRRYRSNMERLRSGKPEETAYVVRMLMRREYERSLSDGERKMLSAAKRNLFSELSLVTGLSEKVLEGKILSSFTPKTDTENGK